MVGVDGTIATDDGGPSVPAPVVAATASGDNPDPLHKNLNPNIEGKWMTVRR